MPKWAPQAPSLFLCEPPAITREVMDPREANRLYTCYPFLASSATAFSLHLYYRIFFHGHSLRTPLQHLGRDLERNKTVFCFLFFFPRRTLTSEILDCKYIPAPFGETVHLSCPSLEASGVSVSWKSNRAHLWISGPGIATIVTLVTSPPPQQL